MKKLLSLIILMFSIAAFGQTNAPTVQAVVQTNINQVMIEILSGVKGAGSEIYAASKEAIHKSVDFVQAQAPEVVSQFLVWKMCYSIIWAAIFLFIASIIWYFAGRLRKFQKIADTHVESIHEMSWPAIAAVWKYVLCVVACLFVIFGVGSNLFTIAEIKVAPKVYIIEYVVDLVKDNTPHR